MDAQEPTIDNLIVALPLAEKVPVVALNALLAQRERLDEEQEIQLQQIHKKYAERIKPFLARVPFRPLRSRSSFRARTRCPRRWPNSANTSRRARRPRS